MGRIWLKIGEVATQIGVKTKELRYWERVIPELRVRRSKGNLRYYHVDDLKRLIKVRDWLQEGHTVADCRELLINGHLPNLPSISDGNCNDSVPLLDVDTIIKDDENNASSFELREIALSLKKLIEQLSLPVK